MNYLDQNKALLRPNYPELDGLRFFAFMLVFIHHHTPFSEVSWLSLVKVQGWIGVDLFFVLSTFLLTKLLIIEYDQTKAVRFKKFYLRRVLRIWPIYFLFIGFVIGLIAWFSLPSPDNVHVRILGLLFFSDNIVTWLLGAIRLQFTAHLWTISFEEQYYLVLPFVVLFLIRCSPKTRAIFLGGVLIVFNVIRIILIGQGVSYHAIYILPFTHFESSILGIVMGFGGLDFLLKRLNPGIAILMGIGFFCLLESIPKVTGDSSYWQILSYTFAGIAACMFIYGVRNNEMMKRLFSMKPLTFLGKRSYGLYVYHLFTNFLVTFAISNYSRIPSDAFSTFFMALVLAILASVVSYALIEKPFLKLKENFR